MYIIYLKRHSKNGWILKEKFVKVLVRVHLAKGKLKSYLMWNLSFKRYINWFYYSILNRNFKLFNYIGYGFSMVTRTQQREKVLPENVTMYHIVL